MSASFEDEWNEDSKEYRSQQFESPGRVPALPPDFSVLASRQRFQELAV